MVRVAMVSVCWPYVNYQQHCLEHEVDQALAAAVEPCANAGAFSHV